MKIIIPNGGQRNPRCLRHENRVYGNQADMRRAATLLRKAGNRVTDYIDCGRHALQISRYEKEA